MDAVPFGAITLWDLAACGRRGPFYIIFGDFAALSLWGRPHGAAPLVKRNISGRAGEDTRPYGGHRSLPFFFVGAGHWPARRGLARREGHTPGWLLSAFGRFTFSPSPTDFKDTFRVWVGEPLGAPAGAAKFLSENKTAPGPTRWSEGGVIQNISTNPLKPGGGSCGTRP